MFKIHVYQVINIIFANFVFKNIIKILFVNTVTRQKSWRLRNNETCPCIQGVFSKRQIMVVQG